MRLFGLRLWRGSAPFPMTGEHLSCQTLKRIYRHLGPLDAVGDNVIRHVIRALLASGGTLPLEPPPGRCKPCGIVAADAGVVGSAPRRELWGHWSYFAGGKARNPCRMPAMHWMGIAGRPPALQGSLQQRGGRRAALLGFPPGAVQQLKLRPPPSNFIGLGHVPGVPPTRAHTVPYTPRATKVITVPSTGATCPHCIRAIRGSRQRGVPTR